jgi:hypothetical protein
VVIHGNEMALDKIKRFENEELKKTQMKRRLEKEAYVEK